MQINKYAKSCMIVNLYDHQLNSQPGVRCFWKIQMQDTSTYDDLRAHYIGSNSPNRALTFYRCILVAVEVNVCLIDKRESSGFEVNEKEVFPAAKGEENH